MYELPTLDLFSFMRYTVDEVIRGDNVPGF